MDVTGQTGSTAGADDPANGSVGGAGHPTANGHKPGSWADVDRTDGWSSAGAALEPGFEPLTPWHATVADRRGIDALTGADPLTTTLVRAPEPVRNGQHHPYGDLRPLPEPSSPGEDPYADEFAQSSAEFARHAAFDEPTPARGTPALGDEPGLPPVFTPYHPAPVPVASQARPLPEQAPASVPPEVVPIPVMPPLPTAANSALTMPTGGYPVPPPGLRPSLPAELSGPVPSAPPADAPLAAMAEAATRAVPPATEQRLPSGPGRDAEPPAETDDGMSLGARFGMAFAEPPLPQRPSQTSRPGMLGSRPGVPTQHSAPGGLADPGRRLPAPDVVPPPGAGNGEFATGENDAPDRAALDAQRNPADRAGLDDRRNGAGASGAADRRPSEHGAAQQIPQAAAAGPEHGRGERGDVPPPPGLPGQPTFVSQVRPYLPPAPQPHLPQPAAQQHAAQQAGRPAEGQPEGDQPGAEHLPQRVPAVPDVPPAIHPVVEPEPQVAATPQLDRIASHLRRDDVPTEERPDGFDVDAVLRAVRGVAGVRDAALRTTATGAHHLRLDLAEGADPAAISRMVARMLQEQMGIDAAPAGPVVPRPAPASDTPPPTATLPAPRSGAGAAPPPGLTGAHPDPLSDALPREPRRRHPVSVPRRAPGELRDRVAALRSVSSEPELPAAASPPPLPTERDQGPRAIIEHVQTSTFGLDATVEVRLNTGDRQAVGVASGPAVDAYVLRLCAAATAVAIDDLLREGTTTGESGRCFIEQATIVPMGSCEVAVVVVLLVCGGWVEQLAGSALVAGDPRRAVVRATLSAVNRRLAALLP